MRTTIQIPDRVLKELLSLTRSKTKTGAILWAIRDFMQRQEMARLKRLSGRIKVDLDWKDLEEVEFKRASRPG